MTRENGDEVTTQSQTEDTSIALENLKKYIRYQYKEEQDFVDELTAEIQREEKADVEQARERRKYLKKILSGKKPLGDRWQERIERLCKLPKGALKMPVIAKKTAYILVSCCGNDAQKLYSAITHNPDEWRVVDEIGLVSGNADLFIRIHGSEDQISQLLTKGLYSIPDVQIQGTNTLFAFQKLLWQRTPIKQTRSDFGPPYWLDTDHPHVDRQRT